MPDIIIFLAMINVLYFINNNTLLNYNIIEKTKSKYGWRVKTIMRLREYRRVSGGGVGVECPRARRR